MKFIKKGLKSYLANCNVSIVTEPILIPSTYVEADTIAFRQWHHWNYLDNLARLELKKGLQTFTIHIVEVGDMNFEHISFELIK